MDDLGDVGFLMDNIAEVEGEMRFLLMGVQGNCPCCRERHGVYPMHLSSGVPPIIPSDF